MRVRGFPFTAAAPACSRVRRSRGALLAGRTARHGTPARPRQYSSMHRPYEWAASAPACWPGGLPCCLAPQRTAAHRRPPAAVPAQATRSTGPSAVLHWNALPAHALQPGRRTDLQQTACWASWPRKRGPAGPCGAPPPHDGTGGPPPAGQGWRRGISAPAGSRCRRRRRGERGKWQQHVAHMWPGWGGAPAGSPAHHPDWRAVDGTDAGAAARQAV